MLPKVASQVEIFNAWHCGLEYAQASGFYNFVSRELFPPDGIGPKISDEEMAQFPVTAEVEGAFERADTEFMRRWRAMDDEAKKPYFQ
jgi:hypothetical protein